MLTQLFLAWVILSMMACANPGRPGPEGPQGEPGLDGKDGLAGGSCSVQQFDSYAYIECDDGTFAYIYNGEDGKVVILPPGLGKKQK